MQLIEVKKQFEEIKKNAKCSKYIACFGKTFIDKGSEEYKISEKIGALIIKEGFGVLHGGYIGTMEAVSEGANKGIKDFKRNEFWNIGVPMKLFDKDVKRATCLHLETDDIFDRKRVLIELCDLCVVLPVGGVGTLLEAIEIFHLNQINEKFGEKIRQIIFFGKIWENLISEILNKLNLDKQSKGESFITFVNNLKELEEAINKKW